MLKSEKFDDVYFSAEDGLAETRHVFLEGNDLPARWRGREHFTICETGFGTGLNFLATMQLWLDCDPARRPKRLHFISFEKYPLSKNQIRNSLSQWDVLKNVLDLFLSKYSDGLKENTYTFPLLEGVDLTLITGDVNETMSKQNFSADCWFLDGFKPSTNPDMWSDTVFQNMARLSAKGASFATFTAAGIVRRGLAAQGFVVCKVPGFGRKREMCVGYYEGASQCA